MLREEWPIEAILQLGDKDRTALPQIIAVICARGSGRVPAPRLREVEGDGRPTGTALPPGTGRGLETLLLHKLGGGMKVSPANEELAEEINIIPTSSLHSCSGGQGQGKLQVQASTFGNTRNLLAGRFIPSLPSRSPSQRRLGSPAPVPNPWKSRDSPSPRH